MFYHPLTSVTHIAIRYCYTTCHTGSAAARASALANLFAKFCQNKPTYGFLGACFLLCFGCRHEKAWLCLVPQ